MTAMEYTERLILLEGLLSTLPVCQGWMIARCRFSLGNRRTEDTKRFPLQILKKDERLAKIRICSILEEEEDLLDVTLIDPKQTMASRSKENIETEKEDHSFKVTREETDHYLREVKDQNPIHRGKGAIAPGFLMANKILKQISPKIPFQAEFRFLTPLQIEESGRLEFWPPGEEKKSGIKTEKASEKMQKIQLRTPQNIILKAEITEHEE